LTVYQKARRYFQSTGQAKILDVNHAGALHRSESQAARVPFKIGCMLATYDVLHRD
jgi:hypothetical protein